VKLVKTSPGLEQVKNDSMKRFNKEQPIGVNTRFGSTLISPVNIRKKGPDPEQIATKGFFVLNRSLGHKQLQKKNCPKSDHGKWVKLHFEFLVLALPLGQ
jgi:hypothetical protein